MGRLNLINYIHNTVRHFYGVPYHPVDFHIFKHISNRLRLFRQQSNSNNLSIPPEYVSDSETYRELNRYLYTRLRLQYLKTSDWNRLLVTTSSTQQDFIREELRSKFLSYLNPWPGVSTDLNPQQKSWFSQDGIDVSLVYLQTQPGIRLKCALLVPKEIVSPQPAMLVLHGFGGNLQSIVADIDYHHGFGLEIAKKGFVVLAPLRVASNVNNQSRLGVKALASGWVLEAISLWQLKCAVDYLFSLEGVDYKHIGVYGISHGGQHALRLGAIEQRLSLIICSGYFTDRFNWLFGKSPLQPANFTTIIPDMALLFNDLNLVASISPRFFGVESGVLDPRNKKAKIEFEKVSRLYKHLGFSDRACFIECNGGHEVFVENVFPFIKDWLNTKL